MIVSSYFTNSGAPAVGLTPIIRIWEVTHNTSQLIIHDDVMNEIGDGFYHYSFDGFEDDKTYLFRCDGGPTLPGAERYQVNANNVSSITDESIAAISKRTWDTDSIGSMSPGSFGEKINQIKASTDLAYSTIHDIPNLLATLIKYNTNRTKIDPQAKTLTVYDNDDVTPLRVFELKDQTGTLSTTEVYERVPT